MKIQTCFLLVTALLFSAAHAQTDCSNPVQAKATVLGVDGFLEAYFKDNRHKRISHDQEVDALVDKMIAQGKWKAEQKAPFFLRIVKSDEFQRIESEKMTELAVFNTAVQNMLAQREKQDFAKACVNVPDIARTVARMRELGDTQHSMLLERISGVAKANGI